MNTLPLDTVRNALTLCVMPSEMALPSVELLNPPARESSPAATYRLSLAERSAGVALSGFAKSVLWLPSAGGVGGVFDFPQPNSKNAPVVTSITATMPQSIFTFIIPLCDFRRLQLYVIKVN